MRAPEHLFITGVNVTRKVGGVECVVYTDNVLPQLSEPMSERSHKDKDTFLPCLLVLACVDASKHSRIEVRISNPSANHWCRES